MLRWGVGFLIAAFAALFGYSANYQSRLETRYPPVGQFVTVEGVRLHYLEAGSGQPVVLLHGAGANLHDWIASLFDDLAAHHRVIAFDRPGHGYSGRIPENGYDPRVQARLIHAALNKMGLQRPILVGHSWSGALVLAYALEYGTDLKGVVVISGVSHPWEGDHVPGSYRIAALPVIGELFRGTLVPAMGELRLPGAVKSAFAPNPPTEDYAEKSSLRLLFRSRAFLFNARDVIHLKSAVTEMSGRYGAIRVPMIIFAGMDDSWVPTKNHAQALNRVVRDSELVTLNGVGHMPHHIRPLLIVDAIGRLARRADPRLSTSEAGTGAGPGVVSEEG